MRNQGMRARYQYEMAGHNYRLTDLHAALGIPQLEKLQQLTDARRHNAEALSEGLDRRRRVSTVPAVLPGREHVWHQYTILVGDDAPVTRDELAAKLTETGIGNGIYYPKLVFDYDCYRDNPQVIASDVPVAAEGRRAGAFAAGAPEADRRRARAPSSRPSGRCSARDRPSQGRPRRRRHDGLAARPRAVAVRPRRLQVRRGAERPDRSGHRRPLRHSGTPARSTG